MTKPKIRPVVIYALEDALKILRTAQDCGIEPWLITPKGAAAWLGSGYLKSLIKTLEKKDVPFTLSVDCNARAGRVLSCLKYGISDIIYTGDPETLRKLQQLAREQGAHVAPTRPEALDIRATYGYDRHLKSWWNVTC